MVSPSTQARCAFPSSFANGRIRAKGGFKDLRTGNYDIIHILPLKDGGIVFCTLNPAFGVFDANDKKTIYKGPSIAEYRAGYKGFLISRDGNTLQFSYELMGQSPGRFSISERSLVSDPPKETALSPPITQAPGLNITNWEHHPAPMLNGRTLKIRQDEFSFSLAISPDKNTFLSGTNMFLRLFDRDGNRKWEALSPGAVYSVNISEDGRIAAAALGDGTLRWYRMKDGKQLLALFPHRDRKRWVLWTPSGYYDASPGAEELIGWHVNNGREEAADFFPVSRFRATYYRPDVVAKTLETLDEDEAIKLANRESGKKEVEAVAIRTMFPPVVNILSPTEGSRGIRSGG